MPTKQAAARIPSAMVGDVGAEDGAARFPAGRPTRKDLVGLLAVLLLAAGMRVWLIAHTDAIAEDGTTYVRMARALPRDLLCVIQDNDYHIGYPLAVSGVHRVLTLAGAPEERATWDLSGQVVSLLASLLATLAVWTLTGMCFDWRAAWLAALLLTVGRKWSWLGADVLSDALAVSLQIWAAVLAVAATGQFPRGSKRALLAAAAAGACVGLGYEVRPESLLVAPLVVLLWLAFAAGKRAPWRVTVLAVVVFAAAAVACALPYMLAIGGLTKKKMITDIVASPLAWTGGVALLLGRTMLQGSEKFVSQVVEAAGPVATVFLCLWLTGWVVARARGRAGEVPSPRPAAAVLMAISVLLLGPLWAKFYAAVGYLSHRHTMYVAAVLSPLAGAGAVLTVRLVGRALGRLGPRWSPLAWCVPVLAAGAVMLSLRPLHVGKACYPKAGEYLRRTAPPETYVITNSLRILHYCQREGHCLDPGEINASALASRIRQARQGHVLVVLGERDVGDLERQLGVADGGKAFDLRAEFACGADADRVRVYSVDPSRLPRREDDAAGGGR